MAGFDKRARSERLLMFAIVLAGLVMGYLTLFFDPVRAEIASAKSRIQNTETQISTQRTAYATMQNAVEDDPDKFANDRLAAIRREQELLTTEIESLAGDLISPNEMTNILTSVLDDYLGLQLVHVENIPAAPLRTDVDEAAESQLFQDQSIGFDGTGESDIAGQVYAHGLHLEFKGDFFNTLKYLKYLEDLSGSFFWDTIHFKQEEWPNAHIILEIHSLSTDRGYIGV